MKKTFWSIAFMLVIPLLVVIIARTNQAGSKRAYWVPSYDYHFFNLDKHVTCKEGDPNARFTGHLRSGADVHQESGQSSRYWEGRSILIF